MIIYSLVALVLVAIIVYLLYRNHQLTKVIRRLDLELHHGKSTVGKNALLNLDLEYS